MYKLTLNEINDDSDHETDKESDEKIVRKEHC